MNCAPERMHALAVSASSTVPAPTIASVPKCRTTSSISFTAPGTVIVISRTERPPFLIASMARFAMSAECARITGITPTSTMLPIISDLVMLVSLKRDGLLGPELKFAVLQFFGSRRHFAAGHLADVLEDPVAYLFNRFGSVDHCARCCIKIALHPLKLPP